METGSDNKNTGEPELHQTPQSTEQGHGSPNNNYIEAHHSSPPPSSSPPNPFQVPSDATNNTSNECLNNDTPSEKGSFHEPTNTESKTPSCQNQPLASCETSEDDDGVPISSMTKHEHGEVANQGSSEIQNPQVQLMERPGESTGTSPQYIFPPHVFSSNTNSPVEWSTASNESLFSIYMGNTSFSNELVGFKSGELDKPGEVFVYDQPNASLTQQQPPAPVNKFNDISQRTAEQQLLHQECSKATEAKAAETMREVIMESSQTTYNVGKGDDKASNSNRPSDGSVNSYAFQSSKGRDKRASSKGAGEKENQLQLTEKNETPNTADQAPKSNKWLCFSCCSFCN
ncbi:hypothetical protein Fmac_025889 [Flemingia macrophylla]|uniref:Uncharacterized protein n=1 Tax=Flemingia macrophylla TaxID=520843 RepID=A0ABD1LDA5_9FABA